MNWQKGRQGTGYLKAKIVAFKRFDCYLIKYPVGSFIPCHTDPVTRGYKHYRINVVLKGDNDSFVGKYIFKWWRIILFRPDIMPHSVLTIRKERLLLSIGWLK